MRQARIRKMLYFMRKRHQDLKAWQESRYLVRDIYRLTETFPKSETYGLCSQMRRAAISIPSNIAEGAARASRKDFCRFVSIARGSLAEIETQLILASDLGYLTPEIAQNDRVKLLFKLLSGLVEDLKT